MAVEAMEIHKTRTTKQRLAVSLRAVALDRGQAIIGPFIKKSASGKRYFVLPVPSRRQLISMAIGLIIATIVSYVGIWLYQYFGPHNYRLSSAEKLLSAPSMILAKSITFDSKKQTYTFSHGAIDSDQSRQSGATLVAASLPVHAAKGITVTDPNYKVDIGITPQIDVMDGKQDQNRLVYPFRNNKGWLVYTAQGTGIKEDIVLQQHEGDTYEATYQLKLPEGTEARKEIDGSIGVYGSQLFINNIITATDNDAGLLQKARENAAKNLLLFVIPKPTVVETGKQVSTVHAEYRLEGNKLIIKATGLAQASYPLSIDPSIYIVTAQQFMSGNNETNVDFDVVDKLIRKSPTTGARFNTWNTTTALTQPTWSVQTVKARDYVYAMHGK